MRFGLFYEMEVKPGAYTEEALYDALLRQVVRAEELGFYVVWLPEHHYNVEYSHISAPDIALMKIAEHTTSIRLGPAIAILPIQHPIMVAERYATLDLLSGGRLEMGVGRGAYSRWLDVFVPGKFASLDDTREAFVEAIEIIRKAWTEEGFTHEGQYYRIEEPVNVIPKPLQKPHPRFHVPCTGPDSIDRYPRLGINAMTHTQFKPLAKIEAEVPRFRKAWAEARANPNSLATTDEGELSCLVNIYCAPTRRQAMDELREHWEWYAIRARDFYFKDRMKQFGGDVPPEIREMFFPGYPDPDWETFVEHQMVCVGSPDDCYEYVATLDRWGVDTFFGMFQMGAMPFDMTMRSIELFGKEVLPRFVAS